MDPNSPQMGQMPPGQPPMGQPMDQSMGQAPSMGGMVDMRTHVEEIAEAIIDEKWEELVRNLNKFSEWKEKTDSTISKMEQEITDVRDSFDKLHRAIIGKIGEYDQNILNVGTEIKAMERVFQKILPTFTENVNELAQITKDAKQTLGKQPAAPAKASAHGKAQAPK